MRLITLASGHSPFIKNKTLWLVFHGGLRRQHAVRVGGKEFDSVGSYATSQFPLSKVMNVQFYHDAHFVPFMIKTTIKSKQNSRRSPLGVSKN